MPVPDPNRQIPEALRDWIDRFDFNILLRRLAARKCGRGFTPINNLPAILWGTDSYADFGRGYRPDDEISLEKLKALGERFRARAGKDKSERSKRVRDKAEVFTPAWVCAFMNEFLDEEWFGRKNVFTRRVDAGWEIVGGGHKVKFPRAKRGQPRKGWKQYVASPRLEITCGEAPFIASRYDAATGEPIPVKDRIGILDRKLRIVSENAKTAKAWLESGYKALESVYGFEWQGDSLLLARLNVVATFEEHYVDFAERFGDDLPGLTRDQLNQAAEIAAYNFFQMDGLTGATPDLASDLSPWTSLLAYAPAPPPNPTPHAPSLFESPPPANESKKKKKKTKSEPKSNAPEPVYVCQWDRATPKYLTFMEKKMTFDFIIGNPPYQIETEGSTRTTPVYCDFMDAAYEVGNNVELITPGRFLFRAGFTSEEWDDKMLSDPHLKVLEYEPTSESFFSDVDIKGGVVITYRNREMDYEPINVFFAFPELKSIYLKVHNSQGIKGLDNIMHMFNQWNTKILLRDYPAFKNLLSSSAVSQIASNAFTTVSIFKDTPPVAIVLVL